jgi:hypothetical protein
MTEHNNRNPWFEAKRLLIADVQQLLKAAEIAFSTCWPAILLRFCLENKACFSMSSGRRQDQLPS